MVLVMLVVVSTLTGAVMLVYLARHRLVTRDVQRVQAAYTAEAAVYAALVRFEADPTWRADEEALEIPEFVNATSGRTQRLPVVSARALGGYLQIRASATEGRARATVHALFGQSPFGPFERAVVLGDTTTALTLTGSTRIRGDILTGSKGARAAPLRRRPFTGSLDGEVERLDEAPLPTLDVALLAETRRRFEGYLDALPDSLSRLPEVWSEADAWRLGAERLFVDSLQILYVGEGGSLTEADSALLRRPVYLVGAGDLTVSGSVRLAAGSTLLADGTLRVSGALQADDCVLFADRVVVSGPAEFSGQVLARRAIDMSGGAYLRDPSLLYVSAEDGIGPREDRIEIGRAVVDGMVVYPPYAGRSDTLGDPSSGPGGGPRGEPVRVVLDAESVVRGSVFNGRKTEVAGRVEGTLLTYQTYFFASPASYVNWLNGPVLDREARPDPYLLPLLFPGRSRPSVLRWAETTGDGSAADGSAVDVPLEEGDAPAVSTDP